MRTTRSSTSVTTASAVNAPALVSTPQTRPCATPTRSTGVLRRSSPPSASSRRTIASTSSYIPPRGCQAPNACSTYPATASAAGARRGSAPAYVAKRSMTICSRGSRAVARARSRSVHHGFTRSASRGSGIGSPGSGRRGGNGGGPVRKRSDARHIDAHRARKRIQSAPEPGDHSSSAASARGRSADSSSTLPSANSYRVTGSTRSRSRPSSANTHGIVSSEGPASHTKPSRSTRAHFPPGAASRSKTVTSCPVAASSIAAASPPTPAPTTATFIGAAPAARTRPSPARRRAPRAGAAR